MFTPASGSVFWAGEDESRLVGLGVTSPTPEPIYGLSLQFEANLGLERVAAEVGMTPKGNRATNRVVTAWPCPDYTGEARVREVTCTHTSLTCPKNQTVDITRR